ncbi:MAG: hypothetical protein AAF532_07940 [Planctomycetota bacterium]
MPRPHTDKQIADVIEAALSSGWRYEKAGPRGRIHGRLLCGGGGCNLIVYGTPADPDVHAKSLRGKVRRCDCG